MRFYKSAYFVPALSFAFFAVMFKFGPDGISWFWADQPIVAIILAGTSAVFWVQLVVAVRRRSRTA